MFPANEIITTEFNKCKSREQNLEVEWLYDEDENAIIFDISHQILPGKYNITIVISNKNKVT